jgi:predicted nuclease of predicted toxin-antitoxin system
MKLLFDENLSYKLCSRLGDTFPHSVHVRILDFEGTSDMELWDFAKKEGFIIVTKNFDFNDISTIYGFPPHVIWIKVGNSTLNTMENILRTNYIKIKNIFRENKCGIIELN